jgi:hypothetical protein
MKNLLFNLKAVQTGSYKPEVGARTETLEVGAGAAINSFGSASLLLKNLCFNLKYWKMHFS